MHVGTSAPVNTYICATDTRLTPLLYFSKMQPPTLEEGFAAVEVVRTDAQLDAAAARFAARTRATSAGAAASGSGAAGSGAGTVDEAGPPPSGAPPPSSRPESPGGAGLASGPPGGGGSSSDPSDSSGPPLFPAPRSRPPYMRLLSAYLDNPRAHAGVLAADPACVLLLDKFPKARCHALVLARGPQAGASAAAAAASEIPGQDALLRDAGGAALPPAPAPLADSPPDWVGGLRRRHLPLLRHMHAVGLAYARNAAATTPGLAPVRLGYHSLPSLPPLHLHVISQGARPPVEAAARQAGRQAGSSLHALSSRPGPPGGAS